MLAPCKLCGSPAIEQVRGLLVEGDKGYVPPSVPGRETSNAPENASDTRIACSNVERAIAYEEEIFVCVNATGWNKQDFADYTRFVWNRDNASQP